MGPRPNGISQMLFLFLFIAIMGMIVLIARYADKRSERKQTSFREHGTCIKGTVTSVSSVRLKSMVLWEIGAEFEYNGTSYLTASDRLYSKPPYAVGSKINVYFMPEAPNKNMILDVDACGVSK